MDQPKGLRKIVVQEKDPELSQRMLSNSVIALLAVSQLGFGFNFGFQKVTSEKFKKPINLITTFMACFMILSLALSFFPYGTGYYVLIVYFVQYILTVFILFTVKYSLCEFLTDLIAIDQTPFQEGCHDKVGILSWLYTFSMFVVKIATVIVYCIFNKCGDERFVVIVIHIPMLGLDAIPVANYLLYYHVYVRMRDLRIKLKRGEIDLEQFKNTFKRVAADFEKFRKGHDFIIIWSFLTDSPKWIIMIWEYLVLLKNSDSCLLMGCSYAWALHLTIQICLPAVFAEMISVQTDAMKMILQEQQLIEKDTTQALKTACVLEYLKARPLLRRAWRLVPLDLQLPITMLSMCTTYLVVIIQFSHLYD